MNKKKKSPSTYILVNAPYYYLYYAFILHIDSDYKLTVISNNRLIFEKKYKTLKGAKLAFLNMYRKEAFNEYVKPNWSPRIFPDEDWLQERSNTPQANGNRKPKHM